MRATYALSTIALFIFDTLSERMLQIDAVSKPAVRDHSITRIP